VEQEICETYIGSKNNPFWDLSLHFTCKRNGFLPTLSSYILLSFQNSDNILVPKFKFTEPQIVWIWLSTVPSLQILSLEDGNHILPSSSCYAAYVSVNGKGQAAWQGRVVLDCPTGQIIHRQWISNQWPLHMPNYILLMRLQLCVYCIVSGVLKLLL
jgi:hypothetical protein